MKSIVCLAVLLLTGCVSKARHNLEVRAAFDRGAKEQEIQYREALKRLYQGFAMLNKQINAKENP